MCGLTRGLKISPIRIVLLAVLLYLAISHVRHGMIAGIVGAPVWRNRWDRHFERKVCPAHFLHPEFQLRVGRTCRPLQQACFSSSSLDLD